MAADEYRPFRLAGHFLNDKEALVFTSLPDPKGPFGGPGFWVVTPFELSGGGTVFVNRGFVPQGRELAKDRGESPNDAPTEVVGLMRPERDAWHLHPGGSPGREHLLRPQRLRSRSRQGDFAAGRAIHHRPYCSRDAARRPAASRRNSDVVYQQPFAIRDHLVRPRRRTSGGFRRVCARAVARARQEAGLTYAGPAS